MDYSRYPSYRQIKHKRRKKVVLLILLLFIFFTLGTAGFYLEHTMQQAPTTITQTHTKPLVAATIPTPTSPPNSTALGQVVQEALQGTHGTYGIVVKNLSTGEYYAFNPNTDFESGSLYKLWVMTVVYQQIAQGKFHLSDTLSKNALDLYNEFLIDVSDQDTTQTISMTVSDALYQMITISDNDAALLLTDKIGVASIKDFLERNGFGNSVVGQSGNQPTTTAQDIAAFLEKMYKGKLGNPDTTNKMLTLLKQQRLNDKLPKYLPTGVTVAHKTGELDDYNHDAGIVYGPNSDYLIVVLTQSDDTQAAQERIANISQAVYKYFTPNQ